jgi:xanthine permease XanP
MTETRAPLPRALADALGLGQWLRFLRSKPLSSKKKPTDLVYGIDDVPPPLITLFVGMQHVSLVRIQLIYPLFVIQMAGLSTGSSVNMLSLALLALGFAAILQSLPKGPIGSGMLLPSCHTGILLEPSIAALKLGGLPLVFTMTFVVGLVQTALAPLLRRLRPLLPPEIGGLVVFLVGTSVALIGCRLMLGGELGLARHATIAQPSVGREYWLVGGFALLIMVALNVWGKGQARLLCAMIGIMAGYGGAMYTGLLPKEAFHDLADLPLIALPNLAHGGWSVSSESILPMILPFTVAALALTLKGIGDITACQRLNDATWLRPDMASISRGALASGLGNMFAGLIGSLAVTPSTANIGLQSATAVSSRVIGFAVGSLLIALAFLPAVTGSLILMPRPVMGASLVFSSCFVLISGLQTITSRMLDARRTIVIGLAIASAVASEIIPDLVPNIPPAIEPIVGSSIVLGMLTALLLNGVFRLGQRQRITVSVNPAAEDVNTQLDEFFDAAGREWGARPDVMLRVAFGINQAVETVREHCDPQGPIEIEAHFDEFNLDVKITYKGEPLELPDQRPSDREIIETEEGHRRLAGFMLRRNADRVRTSVKDGASVLEFNFEH